MCPARGFTLTEMLVAVALLVVIMLAVSTIFRTSAQTVSTGLALTDLVRRQSAARSSLYSDICGASDDPYLQGGGLMPVDGVAGDRPPFLLIRCQRQLGVLNQAEWNAVGGAIPAFAGYPDPVEYIRRFEFRQDMIGMFSRGQFRRQTGGGPTMPPQTRADQVSDMAYVWYGHLWQPANDSTEVSTSWYLPPTYTVPTWPGNGTPQINPANFYASQWALGRVAMLMAQPANVAIGAYYSNPNGIMDNNFLPLWYFGRPGNGYTASVGFPAYAYLTPETTTPDASNGLLPFESYPSSPYSTPPAFLPRPLPSSLVTDGQEDGTNASITSGYSAGAPWGGRLVEGRYDLIGTHTNITWDAFAAMVATLNNPTDPHYDYWTSQWAENMLFARFQGYRTPDVTGLGGESYARRLSRSVPVLMPSCPRFIVEFAGDFVAQDPTTGLIATTYIDSAGASQTIDYHTRARFGTADYTEPQTDGVIDFNIDAAGRRTIRWYGDFRNEDGAPVTAAQLSANGLVTGAVLPYMPVAPVCYSRRDAQAPNYFQYMPFEQIVPAFTGSAPPPPGAPFDVYTCCWTQQEMNLVNPPYTLAPKLIRITVQLTDPDGRVDQGVTQQYIFPVKSLRP